MICQNNIQWYSQYSVSVTHIRELIAFGLFSIHKRLFKHYSILWLRYGDSGGYNNYGEMLLNQINSEHNWVFRCVLSICNRALFSFQLKSSKFIFLITLFLSSKYRLERLKAQWRAMDNVLAALQVEYSSIEQLLQGKETNTNNSMEFKLINLIDCREPRAW